MQHRGLQTPPFIASLVFLVGVIVLFALNREEDGRTSAALWIPVMWLSIAGSRMVSEWLSVSSGITSPDQYLEGSPLDRAILMGILGIGLLVIISRGNRVKGILIASWPILTFFAYCLLSLIWSDFPEVSIKRWSKAIGDVVMVMIILSDPSPLLAIKRFFSRLGFILVPASILMIKYYPQWGRSYDRWTGTVMLTGVTNNKNLLGMVCLIIGVACCWQIIRILTQAGTSLRNKRLLAQGALLGMTIWLLWKANSATSSTCFVIGCVAIFLSSRRAFSKRPFLIHIFVIVVLFAVYSALFLNLGADAVKSLGRDPTLTGRTDVWKSVIQMDENPVFGAGFESFWLGPRLEKMWSIYWWHPNEAHNGYIEVYLNLGWVGIGLLGLLVIRGYKSIISNLSRGDLLASLKLAYLVVALAYSFTEAGFRVMHPVWICFLFSIAWSPSEVQESTKATVIEVSPNPELSFKKSWKHYEDNTAAVS